MAEKGWFTADTLFEGGIQCLQHRQGYRFSIDAVLLAHFVKPQRQNKILDLGAGCGVVSLILAYRYPELQIHGLELQEALFELFKKNISANKYHDRIQALHGDLRHIKDIIPAEQFDWVVANPPFYKAESGRQSEHSEQALARHELHAGCLDIVEAAFYALKNGGRAGFIYPVNRLAELIYALKDNNLEPKRLQVVYGYPGGVAKTCLLEAHKNGGEGFAVMAPFYVYSSKGGEYSSEMAACYRP